MKLERSKTMPSMLSRSWWLFVLRGIVAFLWPDFTILTLIVFLWFLRGWVSNLIFLRTTAIILLDYIAAWAVLTGLLQIMAAIQMRRVITGEWILILRDILCLVSGLLIVVFHGAGALRLLWMSAVYAIICGMMLIIVGFRMRGAHQAGHLPHLAR
jgi:uncharacterized membrane protein HdeD (DUF308 family)